MTRSSSIVICGLPESGKTTYLAALWHVLTVLTDEPCKLKLASKKYDEYTYINKLHDAWLQGHRQLRTRSSTEKIGLNLTLPSGGIIELIVPDVAGEDFKSLWSERHCTRDLAKSLQAREGLLLFINIDTLNKPRDATVAAKVHTRIGVAATKAVQDSIEVDADRIPDENNTAMGSRPSFVADDAADDTKLVDLLHTLARGALRSPNRRIAIILSAWDLLADDGRTPDVVLRDELPLLNGYLHKSDNGWETEVFGVSAQGGDFYDPDKEERSAEHEAVLAIPEQSRIRVVGNQVNSCDLTAPIAWVTTP